MRRAQRDSLILKLLIAAVALLAVNTLLLSAVLLRQGGSSDGAENAATTTAQASSSPSKPVASSSSSSSGGSIPTSPQPASSLSGGPQATSSSTTATSDASEFTISGGGPVATVLQSTVTPLAKAAGDFGMQVADILPPDEQLQACADSGSLGSDSCKAVVATLEAGYAKVNMPFPDLASSVSADPAGATAPSAPGSSGSDDQDILRAFFSVTVERLERQAKRVDMLGEITMPTNDQITAAVESGTVESEPGQALLVLLREQYQLVGLTFPEPEF